MPPARPHDEMPPIAQTGAAALWRVDVSVYAGDPAEREEPEEMCHLHSWTCIWCSMTPPICGSCRPVTPPCPASGAVHACACHRRSHARDAA